MVLWAVGVKQGAVLVRTKEVIRSLRTRRDLDRARRFASGDSGAIDEKARLFEGREEDS